MGQYIASLSYGKDSIYMLELIKQNKLPLDRIIHVEVWATREINADLPPMVEFKHRARKIIQDRYGIEVEHLRDRETYEEKFYRKHVRGKRKGAIYGFPYSLGADCVKLKTNVTRKIKGIEYIGYAIDEPNPKRQEKIQAYMVNKGAAVGKIYPLVDYNVTEQMALDWCEKIGLLAPVYTNFSRGGCWFCHNQPIEELRRLRKDYPEYWELLLKWDRDSPGSWDANGRTVHDYDRRFEMEEKKIYPVNTSRPFRWEMIKKNDEFNPESKLKLF